MALEPESCCFCISVRVGTLVIGWLSLIGSIISVIVILQYSSLTYSDLQGICSALNDTDTPSLHVKQCVSGVIAILTIVGVISGLLVIISILLLVGAGKNKPALMVPFMVCQIISIFVNSMLALSTICFWASVEHYGKLVLTEFVYGFYLSLEVYFFFVVKVCYKKVSECNRAVVEAQRSASL